MRIAAALSFSRRILGGRRRGGGEGGRNYLRGAVAGVALSLVPLMLVMVVANGMIQGITARYMETSSYHLRATPLFGADLPELAAAAVAYSAETGVLGAWPEIQGPAIAVARGKSSGALFRAIDASLLEDPGFARFLEVPAGEARLTARNDILLGEALAKSLDAGPGDIVSLVTQRGGADSLPRVSPFRVRAIVSSGYRELDALWAFVPLEAGARLAVPGSSRSFVGLKVEDPFASLDPFASRLASLEPEWRVQTWAEIEQNLFRSFTTTRALLLLVMALAVAVAAINVGSALVMLVLERRRELAVLRATGVPPSVIALIFLFAGLATGGAGTLLGLGIGSFLAWRVNDLIALLEGGANILSRIPALISGQPLPPQFRLLDPGYYLERIPVRLDPGSILTIGGLSLCLCLAASILPALRAARLPPLELIRKT
jgi:lipoprotein-releasing system permease protein